MVLHICAYNFLNIQRIFSPKKVLKSWDLALSNQPNVMYVKRVESYLDFQPFQHASTYIAFDGMAGKG